MSTLITENYRDLQAALHATGEYGTMGAQYGSLIGSMIKGLGAGCILDYGCGSRQSLLKTLRLPPDVAYEGYDPAIPAHSETPIPADLVCCIDVLEHIEPELLDNVLDDLCGLCDPYGFFTVHTGPARKVLLDGRNAHLTQEGLGWWLPKFASRVDIAGIFMLPAGFCIFVQSKNTDRTSAKQISECNRMIALHLPALYGSPHPSAPT